MHHSAYASLCLRITLPMHHSAYGPLCVCITQPMHHSAYASLSLHLHLQLCVSNWDGPEMTGTPTLSGAGKVPQMRHQFCPTRHQYKTYA